MSLVGRVWRMRDFMNDIESHIVGLPESWKVLARAIDGFIKDQYPDYTITQIKEKFGEMRYYFSLPEQDIGLYLKVMDYAALSAYME